MGRGSSFSKTENQLLAAIGHTLCPGEGTAETYTYGLLASSLCRSYSPELREASLNAKALALYHVGPTWKVLSCAECTTARQLQGGQHKGIAGISRSPFGS